MLPPCFRTLTQTIKRVQFVSSVAKWAHRPTPSTLKPAENGYLFRNDKFQINWFEGSAVPDADWKVLEVQGESDEKDDEDEDLNHENDELVYGPDDEIEEEDDCDDVEDDWENANKALLVEIELVVPLNRLFISSVCVPQSVL